MIHGFVDFMYEGTTQGIEDVIRDGPSRVVEAAGTVRLRFLDWDA